LREIPGTGGDEVGFPELLVRTAVYQMLRPRERRELHLAASRAFTGRGALEHRAAASVVADPDLAAEAEGYGWEDLAGGRSQRGVTELRLALSLTPAGPSRRWRLLGLIEALLVAGEVPAEPLIKELDGLPDDPWSGYVKGYLALVLGRVDDAELLLVGSRSHMQNGPSPNVVPADLGARVASLLAIVSTMRLDCCSVLRYSDEAIQPPAAMDEVLSAAQSAAQTAVQSAAQAAAQSPVQAAAQSPVQAAAQSPALCTKAVGLALCGRSNEALSILRQADNQRDGKARDALVARGIVRLWTDQLESAQVDLSVAVQDGRTGWPISLSVATGFLGHVAFRRGMLGEARRHGEAAVVMASDAGRLVELPLVHALAALPCSATADFEDAQRHVELAGEWAHRAGTRSARAHASAARAYLAQAQDDAEGLYKAAVEFTEVQGSLDPGAHAMGPVLAQSLVALGRLDEAGSALDDFERVLNRTDRVSGRAAAARVRGQVVAALGDWERADTLFAEAAAASETLGMSLASAFAHLAWGLAAIRAGKRKIGTRELILARDISEHSGAQAYALLADRSLGTLGVVPTPGSLIGAGLLTAKEDAVVRLAISGCTNAEMATRLVVNVKTVEYHLTHIYAKLRVTSRRELVTRLSQLAADGGQLGPGS
jgi:ATP/maltotriose-dependent transcriptional regulator MalT